jgi:hypothetical protein
MKSAFFLFLASSFAWACTTNFHGDSEDGEEDVADADGVQDGIDTDGTPDLVELDGFDGEGDPLPDGDDGVDSIPVFHTLTVTVIGEGTVTSDPAGIDCGSDCAEDYEDGTVVTLTASPDAGSMLSGWSGGGCSGTDTCVVSVSAPTTVTAEFVTKVYNYAFISPTPQNGDMSGISGADSLCETWASSGGIGGTYVAILSTSTQNASARLGTARGWVRPDNRPVGDLPSEIFNYDVGLLAPLWITANGSNVGAQSVWSASDNEGIFNASAGGTDCSAWSSSDNASRAWYGFSNTTAEWLSRGALTSCDQQLHIYCFQIDHTAPLDLSEFAESGRIMFVSAGFFDATTGLAGADALCAYDAATYAPLAGRSFLAFLAGDGASAASRFTSSGTAIVRVDGLRVADNFTALTTADLIHPPNIKADGSTETWRVFTGASTPTTAGTGGTTCAGWTSTSSNATEGFAYSASLSTSERLWFGSDTRSCSGDTNVLPVYCLEE